MNRQISLVGLLLVFLWEIIIMVRLTEPKYSRKITLTIWSCIMVALLLTGYILMYTLGIDRATPILGIISMFVIIAVMFIVSTDCVPKKVFLVFTYFKATPNNATE